MNYSNLKQKAKLQIKGKIGILFLITLLIGLVSFGASILLSFIPIIGPIVSLFITPAFSLSMVIVYINVVNAKEVTVSDAFSGFKYFWEAFKVHFLVGLYTFLWSLLFLIPGIIKSFSYSMSMYILAESPNKSANTCITESKQMMDGHKLDLFILELSFIGWALLCVVTVGIAAIWVGPYMSATYVNFYNEIKPKPIVPEINDINY